MCQVSGESVVCTVDLPAWSSCGLSLNNKKALTINNNGNSNNDDDDDDDDILAYGGRG